MFLSIFERALELFSLEEWRLYVATVLGRTGLRVPFGARRKVLMPDANRPASIAKNTSKGSVLLVNVQMQSSATTAFASSPDIGANSYIVEPADPGAPPEGELFALRPSEELFAAAGGPQVLSVGQEWY